MDLPLSRGLKCALLMGLMLPSITAAGRGQALTEEQLAGIHFEQKLNQQVSLQLEFRDEAGSRVKLGDLFHGHPVVLVLGYYSCPMLCTLTANGMVEALQDVRWSIGKEFEVVQVSINPNETPGLASAKKGAYLKRYGRPGAAAGWHFLTGDEGPIRALAGEVGFQYAYDNAAKQYAHPAGLILLTPRGRISKYLSGVSFSSAQVAGALQTAAANQVGTPIERLLLVCFHYNPVKGKYGAMIVAALRLMGVATLVALGWFWISALRRSQVRAEGRGRVPAAASGAGGEGNTA